MSHKHTIELSKEAYELLQQVKKVFISYTGDKEDDWSDEKVIDILAGGFFEQLSHSHSHEHGHEHGDDGCCGGHCGCNDEDCGDDCQDGCGCDCDDEKCEDNQEDKKSKK